MDFHHKISGSNQEQIRNSKHFIIWWVFRDLQEWLSCFSLEEQGVYHIYNNNVWLFFWPILGEKKKKKTTEKTTTRLGTNQEFSFHFLTSVLAQIIFNFEITFPFITFVFSSPSANIHILIFQPCKILDEKFSTWLYVPSSLHSGMNTCWNSLRACSCVYFLSATHLETSRERDKSQLANTIQRKDRS